MKVVEISNACELIKKSKLTKMDDKDKFLVIKAIRALKPVSTEYQDFIKDAQEKLKDEEYDANLKEYQDIQKNHPGLKLSEMTIEEINKAEKLAKYFNDSNKRFSDCIEEEANKVAGKPIELHVEEREEREDNHEEGPIPVMEI